jgi:membrane protein YdbS with pleckstrin-like domain
MTIETIQTEQQPKENKIKKFLTKYMNLKLIIVIFIMIFIMINGSIGLLSHYAVGVNIVLLIITFIIISVIDGVFKHKEDVNEDEKNGNT